MSAIAAPVAIPAPGIRDKMPFDEYLSVPAWDPSLVTSGLTSMLQLDYDRKHPTEPTKAMVFGTAIHTAVLEPDLFPRRYVLWEGGRRSGKVWDAFEVANAGKTILDDAQYTACLGCRDAVRAHPAAAPLLVNARKEISLFWLDPQTGLPCKGRVDILSSATADLKTTTASVADDRALKRIASNLVYDMRMAAYHDGLTQLLGLGNVPPIKIVFVEQAAPHDVRVKTISPGSLARGWDKWAKTLERIAECERSGVWPGCDSGESELEFFGGEDLDITLDGEPLA